MITFTAINYTENDKQIFEKFSCTLANGLSFIDCSLYEKRKYFGELIVGTSQPDTGTILFNDTPIPYENYGKLLYYRRKLGVLRDDTSVLLSNLNAYENMILFGEYFYKKKQQELSTLVMRYAALCKIENALTKLPYIMSENEKLLAHFIMLLIKNPLLYIIDYEFSKLNLSPTVIIDIIKEKRALGSSFLIFGNRDLRNYFPDKKELNI
jgi:ABC-type ATPase involved in cell division